jgi:DinB superfamily
LDKITGDVASAAEPRFLVKLALNAWEVQTKRADAAFGRVSDEQFFEPIAPGKNRVIYLFGHLIAVDDAIFPLFDLGERLYPPFAEIFVTQPDRQAADLPSLEELKRAWTDVHSKLTHRFHEMKVEQWLERHTAISAEDFLKDPSRNRLSVLLSRTSHVAYHLGQLALVKK